MVIEENHKLIKTLEEMGEEKILLIEKQRLENIISNLIVEHRFNLLSYLETKLL